jgi:hypothetical protein
MEEQFLTRAQILAGQYEYPEDFVNLLPTTHFWDRVQERAEGILNIPTVVKVTRDNIYSAKTRDGKRLHSVVIKLKYSDYRFIYLCFNPFDGGLKTAWFRETVKKIRDDRRVFMGRNSEQAIRAYRGKHQGKSDT